VSIPPKNAPINNHGQVRVVGSFRLLRRNSWRICHELQFESDIPRGLPPIFGIFCKTNSDDTFERRDNERIEIANRRRVRMHDRGDQACLRIPRKGFAARKHFEEHAAKGEDVGAGIGWLALKLLGRHIG
jgi:hypothetical protein